MLRLSPRAPFTLLLLGAAIGAALAGACASQSEAPVGRSAARVSLPSACEAPASCNAATELKAIFEAVNGSGTVSEALGRLAFPQGVCAGANRSASLQSSRDTADPRLYLRRGCAVITLTLRGASLEVALQRQHATRGLPIDPLPEGATANINPGEGEALADFHGFGTEKVWSPTKSLNLFDASARRFDTLNCGVCHVDVDVTKSSMGLLDDLTLNVDGKDTAVSGIVVSPYEISPDQTEKVDDGYCVDGASSDLKLLRRCKCPAATEDVEVGAECAIFKDEANLDEEGCKRLDVVLGLEPTQDPRFKPDACVGPEKAVELPQPPNP